MKRRRQKGFTLIELAIVLGVFAVITAAVWMVVGVVYENLRQYQTNQLLQSMVTNIRQVQQRIARFSSADGTDLTATLDNQSAFPVQMRISEGTANGNLNHPWSTAGNSVHAFVRSASEFGLEFKGVPKKACITLGQKLSSGEMSGLTGVSINGSLVTAANLPMTLVAAAGRCTLAANIVEWRFRLHPD